MLSALEVRDHLGRRHGADLHVGVRIDAVLGEVVPQQVIVHRIVERHGELEALPAFRITLVLVLHGERDRLAVDVLDRRHRVRDGVRADAERDRERHRRQHVRGVVFLVERLVADDGPTGGLDHLHVQALLGVEAHRRRHDDRRRAGDRDEADLEVLLLERSALREGVGRGADRQELRHRRERSRGADGGQERASRRVLREQRRA